MATGFGRKGAVDSDMAARRAAFIASERARAQRQPEEPSRQSHGPLRASGRSGKPVAAGERSLLIAYLLWFFLGGCSAHRFYLGYTQSAIAQMTICLGGLGFLLVGTFTLSIGMMLFGYGGMMIGGFWILADIALIPGLVRGANGRLRERETSRAFV
jgi:TM2 domain-containing membrane protein YozV